MTNKRIYHGSIYTSASGRKWTWCAIWKCWQAEDHKYKIYPGDSGTWTASAEGTWLDGQFLTFEAAEEAIFGAE